MTARAQQVHEPADVAIHPRDHRGEGRVRRRLRSIAERRRHRGGTRSARRLPSGCERPLRETPAERSDGLLRRPQLGVWHGVVQVDEEGPRVLLLDQRRRFLREQIVHVVLLEDRR